MDGGEQIDDPTLEADREGVEACEGDIERGAFDFADVTLGQTGGGGQLLLDPTACLAQSHDIVGEDDAQRGALSHTVKITRRSFPLALGAASEGVQ
jgi:hypothetical protein